MDERLFDAADNWCRQENIQCLYYLCAAAEHESIRSACRRGFDCVDVRVDLEAKPEIVEPSDTAGVVVRPALESDLSALKVIARSSHNDSRFYSDGRFPKSACDKLYEIWIEKSCSDSEGQVWVATHGDQVVAYVTCVKEEGGVGRIGLLAVQEQMRGAGVGRVIMQRGLQWFVEEGCSLVKVATQGGNTGALRFYGRIGFVPQQVSLWFHKWFA